MDNPIREPTTERSVFMVDQHHHATLCKEIGELVKSRAGAILVNFDSHDDLGAPSSSEKTSGALSAKRKREEELRAKNPDDLRTMLESCSSNALLSYDIGAVSFAGPRQPPSF